MFNNEDIVKSADIDEIKTMLTVCVRGERFVSGFWSSIIKDGRLRRLLERLIELQSKNE